MPKLVTTKNVVYFFVFDSSCNDQQGDRIRLTNKCSYYHEAWPASVVNVRPISAPPYKIQHKTKPIMPRFPGPCWGVPPSSTHVCIPLIFHGPGSVVSFSRNPYGFLVLVYYGFEFVASHDRSRAAAPAAQPPETLVPPVLHSAFFVSMHVTACAPICVCTQGYKYTYTARRMFPCKSFPHLAPCDRKKRCVT